jgi:ribonuclease P protein component
VTNYAFGKESRLLKAEEYKAIFDNASIKVSSNDILLLARPNGLSQSRLGLIIAKKNIRKAVQRNRIKRLVRESFRHREGSTIQIDVIFLARKGLDQLDNHSIGQQLHEHWDRINKKVQSKSKV